MNYLELSKQGLCPSVKSVAINFLFLKNVQAAKRILPAIQRIRSCRLSHVWSDDSDDHFVFYLFRALLKKRSPGFPRLP